MICRAACRQSQVPSAVPQWGPVRGGVALGRTGRRQPGVAAGGTLLTSNPSFRSLVPCPARLGLGGRVLILGVVSGFSTFGVFLVVFFFFFFFSFLVFITNSYTASSSGIIKLQEPES